ncbi:uncharacterized protein BO80DRAFT_421394 [Aspergillus ibericus CBS 121593]|uniref:Uncharacterized protein n=1 Tax=Aspergillus ibericus CBS 121593 TaxID=1448316 RepID=A0A395HCY0_9EURO|nr:hypothetical protein BO80DRAFT_421394 [Aspergillus ibericus CBS 121593]RAL05329.1 hypothetical protein BO80DRAFT_421394 [Aspergillus ibericus CBS 121593]
MLRVHKMRQHPKSFGSAGPSSRGPSGKNPHPRCFALSDDGAECDRETNGPEFCPSHHQERKRLYEEYKQAESDYNSLVLPKDDFPVELVKQKIGLGRKTLDLRNKVNRRFFSQSGQNRGHIRWILKLDAEVNALEERVRLKEGQGEGAEVSSQGIGRDDEKVMQQGTFVYRSLLSPEVPLSELNHLTGNNPVKIIKECIQAVTDALVERLYGIVPVLDDSGPMIKNAGGEEERRPDDGDQVMRFIFRRFLLWKADADVLARATRAESIDCFLRRSLPGEVKEYIEFFTEVFPREGTLHLLRDAVCDYVSPPVISSISLAGGLVATDNEHRQMNLRAWDILYMYFSDIVEAWNVEFLCFGFADVLLIKRLIALKRYCNKDETSGWLPDNDAVSLGNLVAVLHGFVAATKGYCDPPIPRISEKDGTITAKESRCYLAGRMATSNPLTVRFIQDIVKRVGRYIVVVHDFEGNNSGSPKLFSRTVEGEENPWVTRTKSVSVGEQLDDVAWNVEWSFQNIYRDLQLIRTLRERHLDKDYTEFIIIDRHPGREFQLLYQVSDALMMLAGDPSPNDVLRDFIRATVPLDKQEKWLEGITIDDPSSDGLSSDGICYEGNRVRAWDVMEKNADVVRSFTMKRKSIRERRLICKIVQEIEAKGLIIPLEKAGAAHCSPMLLRGTDGHEDIYFNYNFGPIDETRASQSRFNPMRISTSAGALSEFVRKIQAVHPGSVFAKGRINVHYCAWPMPAVRPGWLGYPTFCTAEGYLYRWSVLPFDFPLAARMWQYYVHNEMNLKFPFVYFVGTTFIVSADSLNDAESNRRALLEAADKHGWTLSVPYPSEWTGDVDVLDISTLWEGIYPAVSRRKKIDQKTG